MEDLDFIVGLMRQNTDELGFIPLTTVEQRYIAGGLYLLTPKIGYLLHGVPKAGHILHIAQACVEYDKRSVGYGMDLVKELIERAKATQCKGIVLRCAASLQSNQFWQAAGFERTATNEPSNRRNRAINVYTFDLWPRLFPSQDTES